MKPRVTSTALQTRLQKISEEIRAATNVRPVCPSIIRSSSEQDEGQKLQREFESRKRIRRSVEKRSGEVLGPVRLT